MNAELRKNFIFSADDFGISPKANENILKLVQRGRFDRVSIMADGRIRPEEAGALLRSGAGLDIHLDIDSGNCSKRKLRDGILKRTSLFALNYLTGKNSPEKVARRWERQIGRFQEIFGKLPDGISSHEHVHFFPPYFRVALRLCDKYGIRYMRFGKEPHKENAPVSSILNFLRLRNIDDFQAARTGSSDRMVSFDWIKNFERFLEASPLGKQTELIFHPEREEELAFLERLG